MKTKHMISIIVALIGVIGTISAAIIGVKWGKSNINVIVELDGKNIVLKDSDVQELASENEDLKGLVSEYELRIEKLESEKTDIMAQLGNISGELNEAPSIEFHNLGLSIDGEEKTINRNKATVYINGVQYYSQDFVDNLLPSNMAITVKDDMLYIGKIVNEKANLFDMAVIEKAFYSYFYDSIKDTYGNVYGSALVFEYHDNFTTFNANRGYSHFKCIVAMQDGYNGNGSLQIKTDGNIVYTSSEITNMTEPFEIDIPINQASTISIGTIGENYSGSRILIANAVLYNQE